MSILMNSCWGCLRPPCGGNAGHGAFEDLQQRLLHAFAADVARDGHVFALLGDLVDLVDVHDTALRCLNVAVRDGKGHVQDAGQGLREIGLAAAGGADHQDVGLLQFDVVAALRRADALVVVVHRHAQGALGLVLPDHVIVQHTLHLHGGGDVIAVAVRAEVEVVGNDFPAQLDALVADVYVRADHEPAHLVLALAAERAAGLALLEDIVSHSSSPLPEDGKSRR